MYNPRFKVGDNIFYLTHGKMVRRKICEIKVREEVTEWDGKPFVGYILEDEPDVSYQDHSVFGSILECVISLSTIYAENHENKRVDLFEMAFKLQDLIEEEAKEVGNG